MVDLISVIIDFNSDFAYQLCTDQSKNGYLNLVSPYDYAQQGCIRFEKSQGSHPRKISLSKRVEPDKNSGAKPKKISKSSDPDHKISSKPLSGVNNVGSDYALVSAASHKVDTSNLISIVQNLRTNEKEFRCSFCQYVSKSQANTKRHLEIKHIDNGVVFQCKMCPVTIKLKANLKNHYMKIHQVPEEAAKAMLEG